MPARTDAAVVLPIKCMWQNESSLLIATMLRAIGEALGRTSRIDCKAFVAAADSGCAGAPEHVSYGSLYGSGK